MYSTARQLNPFAFKINYEKLTFHNLSSYPQQYYKAYTQLSTVGNSNHQ